MNFPQASKRLKISLVVSDLSSSGSGRWGGAVRPFLLAQALQKLDCEVEMLGIAFDSEPAQLQAHEVAIYSYPCQRYSGFFRTAAKLLNQASGDIIYAVKLKPTSYGIALVKKLISRRPLILDIDDWETSWYGGDRWKYPYSLKKTASHLLKKDGALRYPDHPLYLKWMENWIGYADAVTTHTEFLQKRFGGMYVPNGKDTTLFSPEFYEPRSCRLKYGLADYRILMFPGAPRPYKGLEDVLLALDKLDWPDLRLVIVGGSPYDDYDRQLAERWSRWIISIPKLPVSTMPEIVSAAHIIVVPQRDNIAARAQFPLKLTDAMAMAKPIIATRVGDIPKILGGTGYLVDPQSPEQIAETIQGIFGHFESASAKSLEARKRCIQYYSIEAMATSLSQVIAQVRENRPSGSAVAHEGDPQDRAASP